MIQDNRWEGNAYGVDGGFLEMEDKTNRDRQKPKVLLSQFFPPNQVMSFANPSLLVQAIVWEAISITIKR